MTLIGLSTKAQFIQNFTVFVFISVIFILKLLWYLTVLITVCFMGEFEIFSPTHSIYNKFIAYSRTIIRDCCGLQIERIKNVTVFQGYK